MYEFIDKIRRYSIWVLIGVISVMAVKPAIEEFNMLMLIIITETVAILMSGLATYAYTRIDFVREKNNITLASIFLGVHICTGLTVMGVYIAQF